MGPRAAMRVAVSRPWLWLCCCHMCHAAPIWTRASPSFAPLTPLPVSRMPQIPASIELRSMYKFKKDKSMDSSPELQPAVALPPAPCMAWQADGRALVWEEVYYSSTVVGSRHFHRQPRKRVRMRSGRQTDLHVAIWVRLFATGEKHPKCNTTDDSIGPPGQIGIVPAWLMHTMRGPPSPDAFLNFK